MLPDGFEVTAARADYVTITGPDRTRVTWFPDGRVRVFRPNHDLEIDRPTNHSETAAGPAGQAVMIHTIPQ